MVSAPDAALGRRFWALCLDHILIGWMQLGLGLWLAITRSPWQLALVLLLLPFAYFVWFEARTGQTPGKRWRGIVVMHVDGRPLDPRGAVIRNVARIVDFLPSYYLVGTLVALGSGPQRRQRLGDRMAGTIVVPIRPAIVPPAANNYTAVFFAIAAAALTFATIAHVGIPYLS